jgi:hypothetical protein
MSSTTNWRKNETWDHLDFYSSGGVDGSFVESLAPGKMFRLEEVRLHLSVVHASVEDFAIRISSSFGSAYNQVLISQAMNGVANYLWQPTNPMIFNSDDQLVFSLFIKSATNIYGLNVKGWGVSG